MAAWVFGAARGRPARGGKVRASGSSTLQIIVGELLSPHAGSPHPGKLFLPCVLFPFESCNPCKVTWTRAVRLCEGGRMERSKLAGSWLITLRAALRGTGR